VERYRFTISDGDSFEHVGEAPYASPLAAEAHAIQVARELAEDDTWHGGWISVEDIRGNEIAKVSIGIERPLTKSEAVRWNSQQAIQKSNTLIRRLVATATIRRWDPGDFEGNRAPARILDVHDGCPASPKQASQSEFRTIQGTGR
jgi:hypothetical protein